MLYEGAAFGRPLIIKEQNMRQIVVTLTDASAGAKNSDPIPLDIHGRPDVSLQVAVTGTVNWTLQQTLDNPFTTASGSIVWVNHPDANMVAQTVTRQGNYAYIPAAVRLQLSSGSGSAKLTIVQSGDNRA
jgi:hypothetical protein